jgi:Spy/CpxP family protein refolding chaperone
MKKTYLAASILLLGLTFAHAEENRPTTGMPPQMPPMMLTGDKAIDDQVKTLTKEMEDKIKAIREEYMTKIKTIVGDKRPMHASSTRATSTMKEFRKDVKDMRKEMKEERHDNRDGRFQNGSGTPPMPRSRDGKGTTTPPNGNASEKAQGFFRGFFNR